jgi:imidazolonepropionase-like amidohydrolase
MTTFVARQAYLLDEQGEFGGPRDVHVEDGTIVAVGPDLRVPGVDSIDLQGHWLMPGMVDAHGHVAMFSTSMLECLQTPVTQWTLETARNLRNTLLGGVTMVRDAGGADAGVKRAVERGIVPGPRLSISIVALSQTGGHLDGYLFGPGMESSAGYLIPDWPGRPPVVIDGPDEMRRAVREVFRAGGDCIKLCSTGGVASEYDEPEVGEFSPEELAVAVYEAKRKGSHVLSHAYGGEGIDTALDAGVLSIEHGTLATEEQVARMAREGVWLVPTLAGLREGSRRLADGELSPVEAAKAKIIQAALGDVVPMALEHGVRIAAGTDFYVREDHGRNLEEIAALHQAGMSAPAAFLAATREGAELCGWGGEYGVIAPGYRFDAAVFDEDISNPSVFDTGIRPTHVFKDGVRA